jgi:ribosomal-protein-alanine N-acetyltransferase
LHDIQTARLLLEPLVASHAEAMFSVLSEPSLHIHIDSSPPESVDALRQRYIKLEARASPDRSQLWLNWAVVSPGVGPIGFVQATVVGTTAWVAYLLGREYWARGYASEATFAMLGYLASVHQTSLFKATVEVENSNSVALLRRIGFRLANSSELAGVNLSPTERLYVKNAGSIST